jgi:hypothetical protein
MATQATTGQWAKETKNTYMYNTTWGPVYVPKNVAEAAGTNGEAPQSIKLTLENTDA